MFVQYSHCSFPSICIPHHVKNQGYELSSLDELLEGAVDGRADFGALVEIDCGYGTLTDAFGGKFEFLDTLVSIPGFEDGKIEGELIPCRRPCMHRWHRTGSDRIARSSIAPSPLLTWPQHSKMGFRLAST